MKEYQKDIFGGIHLVKVKKNMVNPPTLPKKEEENTLQYVRSAEIHVKSSVMCEKCTKEPRKATHLATAKFSQGEEHRFFFCHEHNEKFLAAFAPYCSR